MAVQITADFKAYQEQITSTLLSVTRNASAVANNDLSFHRSLSDKVSRSLDSQNANFLRLTNKLLKAATKESNIKPPTIQDYDGVDDHWKGIVDVIDDLLEKVDANLDDFNGGITHSMTPPQPATPETPHPGPRMPAYRPSPYSSTPKPQARFQRKVDNYEAGPWKPLLKSKPNSIIDLAASLGSEDTGYHNPYTPEIQQYKYPAQLYEEAEPIEFEPPENSQPTWVDTEAGVQAMLQELSAAKEIAIDLEHNDKNSYVGLVSLMQISTRSKDWVVDTLQPWRENLQVLNTVFTNPTILKVFHGSTSDMIWLQRDLGLYVVGLFDTYHAASALNYPQRSLAALLRKFAHFEAQKQYQLADWRVRPLPQELLDYARADTHYLLYIYDNMRNELVQASTPDNNLVDYVLEHSKKECLQVYERHVYDRDNGLGSDGWMKLLLVRDTKKLDKAQFGILRSLHEWRDQKARELDEGAVSIISNNYLFNCAWVKPETRAQLFGNRELGRASPYVERHCDEIIDAIRRGKREGLEGPSIDEVIERNADKLSTYRQFKHTNPKAKPQEVQQSVAATMQKLLRNGELREAVGPDVSNEALTGRIDSSFLWGGTSPSTVLTALDSKAVNQALRAVMPLHYLVNTNPASNAAMPATAGEIPDATELPQTEAGVRVVQEPDIDVPFTLRDRNRKRSANELETEEDQITTIPADNSGQFAVTDEGKVMSSREARKAFKQARKEAEASQPTDFQPFDYANAQSMLHPAPQPEPLSTNTKPKPLNPFAKALDTSTGARRNRLGKELPGKSHTFKS
ncbi:exosome nuclease subunit [Lithohypha guttulata]|uniref:exosome nuclease subunit n=1 Tax=Lithohypha guttulata TaxID=1690604 RepID=UPI002DDE60BD|nr:exosome nuclease subunit [Lithohypha guttulata]